MLSEGLFFGKIGFDALIGLLPGVGGFYTGAAGCWLLFQAHRVKTSLRDKFLIIGLTITDILIGVFPVAGDILDFFYRVHAWNGRRLISHIDTQLSAINPTYEFSSQDFDIDQGNLGGLVLTDKGKKRLQRIRYLAILFVFGVALLVVAGLVIFMINN